VEGADDLVATMADRQEVFEPQPEEVVSAVAFYEIIRVRVVAAGTLVWELGVPVDEGFGVLEKTHRNERVHKQTVDIRHLEVPAREEPHGRPLGAAMAVARSVACFCGCPTTP
jgi:hypothetical protein